jgi:phosphopantetheine adenylyltransferase
VCLCLRTSIVVQGYIWRYAKQQGASIFFRGIRSWDKDGKEEQALQILNTWGPMLLGPLVWPIPTIFLEGDPQYNHVSSTLIRTLCTGTNEDDHDQQEEAKEALSKLVPSEVAMTIKELYCDPKTKKQ